ncbi:MAG: choice-of-anchor D domain-containing protein [Planctomycetota bacterium]|nr:MAG: choice-of-anchor D domain-containing protein [Planctomycetota bacterium]
MRWDSALNFRPFGPGVSMSASVPSPAVSFAPATWWSTLASRCAVMALALAIALLSAGCRFGGGSGPGDPGGGGPGGGGDPGGPGGGTGGGSIAIVQPAGGILDFGEVPFGESATRTVTFQNVSNQAITLVDNPVTAFVTAGPPGVFTVPEGAQPGGTLQPEETGTASITFTPTNSNEAVEGTATIAVLDPGTGTSFTLRGNGLRRQLRLTTPSGMNISLSGEYDFSFVRPGDSKTQEFILTNLTNEPVTLNAALPIAIGNTTFFEAINPTDLTVPAGGTRSFSVVFRPTVYARQTTTMTVRVQNGDDIPVTLTGGVDEGLLILGDGELVANGSTVPRVDNLTDFGAAEVATAETVTRVFTLFNNTAANITIGTILPRQSDGDVFWAGTLRDTELTPGGTTTFNVTFLARDPGDSLRTIQVPYTQAGSGSNIYTFAVIGRALDPQVRIEGVRQQLNQQTGLVEDIAVVEIFDESENPRLAPGEPQPPLNPPTNVPNVEDNTDFGMTPLGIPVQRRFRISNVGNAPLRLENNPSINIIGITLPGDDVGTDFDQFRVVQFPRDAISGDPVTELAPGESADYILEFRSLSVSRRYPYSADPAVNRDDVVLPVPGAIDQNNRSLLDAVVRIGTNANNAAHNPYFWYQITGQVYRPRLIVHADPRQDVPAVSAAVIDRMNDPRTTYRNDIRIYGDDNQETRLGITVPHGQTSPRRANRTEFGGLQVGDSLTHNFRVRNDSAESIRLTGSPRINVLGSHPEDFDVVIRTVPWTEDETPGGTLLAGREPGEMLQGEDVTFSVTFSPRSPDRRSAEIEITSQDAVVGKYRFAISGRGLGPRLVVTDPNEALIARGATTPSLSNSTELLPPVYIVNMADPSATGQTYRIQNTGNQAMRLGNDTELGAVTLSGPNVGDYMVVAQPFRQLEGGGTEPVDVLFPGEIAFFTIGFDPGYDMPIRDPTVGGSWQHPEETKRFVIVTVNTSALTSGEVREPDAYSFTIAGTAINPKMIVLGNGRMIFDRNYSPKLTNDTAFRDVDMWGGVQFNSFSVRNAGFIHPLPLGSIGQAYLDNEEVIPELPMYTVNGNTVNFLAYPILNFGEGGAFPNSPWDRSVLTRLRVGDTIVVGGAERRITRIYPDVNDVIKPINLPRQPSNLPPPDVIRNQLEPYIEEGDFFNEEGTTLAPLGWAYNLPIRGFIQFDGEGLESNTVTDPRFFIIDTRPDEDTGSEDFVIINPDVTPGELRTFRWINLGGTWAIGQQAGINGETGDIEIGRLITQDYVIRAPADGVGTDPLNREFPRNTRRVLQPLQRVDSAQSAAGEVIESFVFTNNALNREILGQLIPNARIEFWRDEDDADNGEPPDRVFTVESLNPADGRVTVTQRIIGTFDGQNYTEQTYIDGHFRAVIPRAFSLTRAIDAMFIKHDFRIRNELPASLPPGAEVELTVQFKPRWSTGFDRNRHLLGRIDHEDESLYSDLLWWDIIPIIGEGAALNRRNPGGLDWALAQASTWLHSLKANTDPIGLYTEIGSDFVPPNLPHPRGGLEHQVEVNIPNGDIDTYGDWKTGHIPAGFHGLLPDPLKPRGEWVSTNVFPIPLANLGEYLDEFSPDYEFALAGMARSPRIQANDVGDPLKLGAPPFDSKFGARRGPLPVIFDSTQIGQTVVEEITFIALPNLLGSLYQPHGRLIFDPQVPFTIEGPARQDFRIANIELGPNNGNMVPGEPENSYTEWQLTPRPGEFIRVTLEFSPTAVTDPNDPDKPIRAGSLVVPTNDAVEDPLRVPLRGAGEPPPPEGNF